MIKGDPWLQGENTRIGGAEDAATRARQLASRRAIVQFGATPRDWSQETPGFGDIRPEDLAAARGNPFSTLAMLLDTRRRASEDLRSRLGARGTLRSGALLGGENAAQYSQELNQALETNKLLDLLGLNETNFANAWNTLEGQRQGAYGQASERIRANNPATWLVDWTTSPTTAEWVNQPAPEAPPEEPPATPTFSDPYINFTAGNLIGTRKPYKYGLFGQVLP